jgi:hypothetical protein
VHKEKTQKKDFLLEMFFLLYVFWLNSLKRCVPFGL